MRSLILILFILSAPSYLDGQKTYNELQADVLHHNISINPLNILLFQQVGVTYEYRPGKLGFGITPGYIYPNKKEYSNWFIAGPTNHGSLGWYSGWFIIPQMNFYLTKQNDSDEGGILYLAGCQHSIH